MIRYITSRAAKSVLVAVVAAGCLVTAAVPCLAATATPGSTPWG